MTGPIATREAGQELPLNVPRVIVPLGLLETVVEQIINPHPDVGLPTDFPESLRSAANRWLDTTTVYFAPGSDDVLMTWLWPLADAVEPIPSEIEFRRRFDALRIVAAEIPGLVWTRETQRQAMLSFARFPSVSAIMSLVSTYAAEWLQVRHAVRYIAGYRDGGFAPVIAKDGACT